MCDEDELSEQNHRKVWEAMPPVFCTGCGSQQTYNQFNYNLECSCGDVDKHIPMTDEQRAQVRKDYDESHV